MTIRTPILTRRNILVGAVAAGVTSRLSAHSMADAGKLKMQRLAWAGMHLKIGDASLFIDAMANPNVWEKSLGDRLVPVEPSAENYALITHRHPDHFDPETVNAALGTSGTLVYSAAIGPPSGVKYKLRPAAMYEPQLLGEFTATAVPAADGYGDPQVSWIVSAAGRRIIHCGDTLWHGFWWHIGRQFGPFDAAFLPINGAKFSWRQPASDVPAVLTPEQAVAAAVILGARQIVPIHFGVIGADGYAEVDDPLRQLRAAAARRGIKVNVMQPGEWQDL